MRRTYRGRIKGTSDIPKSVATELSNKMDAIDADCSAGKNIPQPSIFDITLRVLRSILVIAYGLAISAILIMVLISMHALMTNDPHIAQFVAEMLLHSGS